MKKNLKLTVMIAFIGMLLVGIVGVKFLYPMYSDMGDRIEANEQTARVANATLEEAKGLNPKKINDELKKLKARVPNAIELPNLIQRINERANTSGLLWLEGTSEDAPVAPGSVVDGSTPDAPQLDSHVVAIKVRGNINNLIAFFESITNKSVGRIVVITGTKITPILGEGGGDPDAVDAQISLSVIGWVDGANIDISGCEKDSSVSSSDCSVLPSS